MGKKSKGENVTAEVAASVPVQEIEGVIELNENSVTIEYKKPRSKNYERLTVPLANVMAIRFSEGETSGEGKLFLKRPTTEAEEWEGEVGEDKTTGWPTITTEDGELVVVNPLDSRITAQIGDGGKKKKKKEDSSDSDKKSKKKSDDSSDKKSKKKKEESS